MIDCVLASLTRDIASIEPHDELAPGLIDYRAGRMDAARAAYQKLRGELPAESQPLLRAEVLIALASIERTEAHFDAAEQGYAQAIDLLNPLDQPIWLDPAGRIIVAYENTLAIMFPAGRIPSEIATLIPAEQLRDQ